MHLPLKHLSSIAASLLISVTPTLLPFAGRLQPVTVEAQTTKSSPITVGELQEFTSTKGGFSLLMPGQPSEEIEPANPQKGSGESRQFVLEGEGGKVAYAIGYVDFPNFDQPLNLTEVNKLLNAARDGSLRSGRLIKERTIALDNYPGRELELETDDGFRAKARFFWVYPRLYILMVTASTKEAFPQEGDRVLDSFRLLANRPPQKNLGNQEKGEINPGRRDEAIAVYEEGDRLYRQGRYQEALVTLQRALVIVREIGDRQGEGIILTRLGRTYDALKEYERSLEIYQQSLAIARQRNDRPNEGVIIDYIGRVYDSMGQSQKALNFQQQALAIFREIGNRRNEGIVLGNIGRIYQNQKLYDKALETYQQTLVIVRETAERQGEGIILDYIGVVYNAQGQYQKAIDSHQQALNIFRQIGNRRSEGIVLANMGEAYANLRDNQKALDFLNQALAIFQEVGDRDGIRTTIMQIEGVRKRS
ncbi:MAG TPA: tetratricopeptide repeat protein [Kamptonema sp.]|nr:tetratricopeptide repeat protein [Kamptonema sp.]